jgi:hypothetical protein
MSVTQLSVWSWKANMTLLTEGGILSNRTL